MDTIHVCEGVHDGNARLRGKKLNDGTEKSILKIETFDF